MSISDRVKSWKRRSAGQKALPMACFIGLSLFCLLPSQAQGQPAPTPELAAQKPLQSNVADATDASTPSQPLALPAAPLPGSGGLPLSNIDLLNKMDDDRLPTSPRRFLKARFKQVRKAKDEKILQLLLVCVGFVGVFVAILALRSVPPARSGS